MQYQVVWFDFQTGLSLGETLEVSESDRTICGDYSLSYKTQPNIRFIYNTEAYSKKEAMELFKRTMRTYVWEMNLNGYYNIPSVDNFDWTHPEGE